VLKLSRTGPINVCPKNIHYENMGILRIKVPDGIIV